MPAAKYRRRNQRNRRREGNAKFVAPIAASAAILNEITVSGAGDPGMNEVYTWHGVNHAWESPSNHTINLQLGHWFINSDVGDYYLQAATNPVPDATGWVVGTAPAPAPTISYTG